MEHEPQQFQPQHGLMPPLYQGSAMDAGDPHSSTAAEQQHHGAPMYSSYGLTAANGAAAAYPGLAMDGKGSGSMNPTSEGGDATTALHRGMSDGGEDDQDDGNDGEEDEQGGAGAGGGGGHVVRTGGIPKVGRRPSAISRFKGVARDERR